MVGLVATWYFNLQYFATKGDASSLKFITDNYVNAASASIANDIIVIALVFNVWSFFEARRLNIKHWWAYVVGGLLIALAFTYPLFLLARERAIESNALK